jgi:hypothetical protein
VYNVAFSAFPNVKDAIVTVESIPKVCNTHGYRCSATFTFDTESLSSLEFNFQFIVLEKVAKSLWLFLIEVSYWYSNKNVCKSE